jgi:hypothetical protein
MSDFWGAFEGTTLSLDSLAARRVRITVRVEETVRLQGLGKHLRRHERFLCCGARAKSDILRLAMRKSVQTETTEALRASYEEEDKR